MIKESSLSNLRNVNICKKQINFEYILHVGMRYSSALTVCEVIIADCRIGILEKDKLEDEVLKSRIFKNFESMVKFRKQVISDIKDMLTSSDIVNVINDEDYYEEKLGNFLRGLDKNPSYLKYYSKEEIQNALQKANP